ncbi:hypothetical protein [Pedococcus sp. P5_B7]
MSRLLMTAGAVLAVLGILLILLPGPGFLVLGLGAVLLVAGLAVRGSRGQTS